MRRLGGLLTTILVLSACSSSSEPAAFELRHPMAPPEQAFAITGAGADTDVVCPHGTWTSDRMETMSGEPMTAEDWGAMFETAVDSDGVAEARAFKEFSCSDGSGTLLIEDQAHVDFADVDAAMLGTGRMKFGTFEISGTGAFEQITGSGEVFADWDTETMVYAGEVGKG